MQTTMDKKSKITSIIFIVSILTITVLLFGFTFYMISCSPLAVKEFDDVESVSIEDYKQKGDEYYVFVYNKNSYKHELLDEMVAEYAEYVRTTPGAKSIYILDYSTNKDIINHEHMDITNTESSIERNIPALLLIKDGKISETKTTVSTIKTALYELMD